MTTPAIDAVHHYLEPGKTVMCHKSDIELVGNLLAALNEALTTAPEVVTVNQLVDAVGTSDYYDHTQNTVEAIKEKYPHGIKIIGGEG